MRKHLDGSRNLAGTSGQADRRSPKHAARRAGISLMAAAAALLVLAPIARAQSDEAGTNTAPSAQMSSPPGNQASQEQEAPPPFPVVRLSYVQGTVQIRRGGQTGYSPAMMNLPLTQGSKIETGANGRAEIEFEDGSVARITPNSSLGIRQLQVGSGGALETAVEQSSGLIYFELRSDSSSPFRVMFGPQTVTPVADSTFRVNLNATPQVLAVIDGKVRVEGAASTNPVDVHQNQMIQFQAGGSAKYTVVEGLLPNGFDAWNDQLDQEAAQEAEKQTPARVQQGGGSIMDSGIGWSDLDNAGGWYPLPGYGTVWQPYGVGAGFNPYGYGSWVGFGGGYSWVSGYPWGWLPFNCGSWNYIGSFGWGWSPGSFGCGIGVGFGYYGGYGYGRRWNNRRCPHTNIHGAPSGYRSPLPPRLLAGEHSPRIVRVGTRPAFMTDRLQTARGHGSHEHAGVRAINYHGEKIEPLHSMMRGVRVPVRNAALYNNYPAHAFQGGVRNAVTERTGAGRGLEARSGGVSNAMRRSEMANRAGTFHSTEMANRGEGFRGFHNMNRSEAFNVARQNSMAAHSFGSMNRATFGQHASFGPRGGFSGERSSFAGSSFHGGGFQGRAGGSSSGGCHGGGGGGGGFHGGGGFSGGGGGHGGGGGGAGGGGGHGH